MFYIFGNVPEGVSVGPSDPSISWGMVIDIARL
ncbi:hypothetical protein LINPERPRIM_LOCUS37578 [Linum perenne]